MASRGKPKPKSKPKPKAKAKRSGKPPSGGKASQFAPYYPRGGKTRDKARRYINPTTGQKISKRQYDKLRRGSSNEGYAKARREAGRPSHMSRSQTLLSDYEKTLRLQGIEKGRGAIRTSAEYKAILADLRSGDKSAGGRMARALEKVGRRPPDAGYAVGDTPRLARRRGRK